MMYFTVIFIFALASSAVSEDYTTKYDNIDLDAIIQNDRLLKNYVDCLLEKGKCTNEGAELKSK